MQKLLIILTLFCAILSSNASEPPAQYKVLMMLEEFDKLDEKVVTSWLAKNNKEAYSKLFEKDGTPKKVSILGGGYNKNSARLEYFLNEQYQLGWKLSAMSQSVIVLERIEIAQSNTTGEQGSAHQSTTRPESKSE